MGAHHSGKVFERLYPQRGCSGRTIENKSACTVAEQVRLRVVRFLARSCLCNHRMQNDWRAWNCPLMSGRTTLMARLCRNRS